MIINLIVATALLLGGGYLVLWLVSPRLRRNIERPKYIFQGKLAKHHQQLTSREENRNQQ